MKWPFYRCKEHSGSTKLLAGARTLVWSQRSSELIRTSCAAMSWWSGFHKITANGVTPKAIWFLERCYMESNTNGLECIDRNNIHYSSHIFIIEQKNTLFVSPCLCRILINDLKCVKSARTREHNNRQAAKQLHNALPFAVSLRRFGCSSKLDCRYFMWTVTDCS